MNIMIIGAYGQAGSLIAREFEKRGHRVTAVAPRKHANVTFERILEKSVLELTPEDVSGFDAVIDSVGVWQAQTLPLIYKSVEHLAQLLSSSRTHLLKVGGANTLFINAARTQILQSLPHYYPAEMQALCDAHRLALEVMRRFSEVCWTYVTPAYKFSPNEPATGRYAVSGEMYTPAPNNDPKNGHNDYISYADYAKGVADIVENGRYIRQRITLTSGDMPGGEFLF